MFHIKGQSSPTKDVTFSIEVDNDGDLVLRGNGVPLLYIDSELGKFFLSYTDTTKREALGGLVFQDNFLAQES